MKPRLPLSDPFQYCIFIIIIVVVIIIMLLQSFCCQSEACEIEGYLQPLTLGVILGVGGGYRQ